MSPGVVHTSPPRRDAAQSEANFSRASGDKRGRLPAVETLAPVTMQRVTAFLPWALVAVILLLGGLVGTSSSDKLIGFGGAVVLFGVALRAARLRLLLGEDVAVVGWFGTRRVPWKEVERFVVNEKGLAIRMRGGLEEGVPAFAMGGWVLKSVRARMQAELERTCERAEEFRRARRSKP